MQALHIVLLGVTAIAFVVAAAPGSSIGTGREHGRLIALVVSGAAVVGNAASLMPATPAWYGRFMIVITFAVALWALLTVLARRDEARDAADDARARALYGDAFVERLIAAADRTAPSAGRTATPPSSSDGSAGGAAAGSSASRAAQRNPQPRAGLYAVPDADIVDAEVVDEAPVPTRPVPTRPVATQETFDDYGPARSRRLRGESYVAAHLGDYLPDAKAQVARRQARQRHADADLRARLNRAYGSETDQAGRITSTRA